jgi:hypothetical protein
MALRLLTLVLLTSLLACSEPVLDLPARTENGLACNPLSMGHCLLPIPTSVWQKNDAAAVTKTRLDLPDGLLPTRKSKDGKPTSALNPAPYNKADGWSPGTSIFIAFDQPIDGANLIPYAELEKSVLPGSPTLLLDAETGERIAHFAEIDENIGTEYEITYRNRGLLIRPAGALQTGRRYVVALTRDLKTLDGTTLSSPAAFNALRSGTITNHAIVERVRPRYAKVFKALRTAGVNLTDVLLAWDFDVASDEWIHRDILAMRDRALAAAGDEGLGYAIISVKDDSLTNSPLYLTIEGTYKSPLFLEDGGSDLAYNCFSGVRAECPIPGYVRGADGLPEQQGTWDRPFYLTIPKAITTATAPLPLIHFGHGLLGKGLEITYNYTRFAGNRLGVAMIATDWTGLSDADVPAVSAVLLDFDKLPGIGYRLTQGLIDTLVLTRTAKQIARDPVLKLVNGGPAFSTDEITFYGISLGGIMGGSFMALSPDITRGVLNVGGSTWSMMMQRSSNWPVRELVLKSSYPDNLDQQILLTLSQSMWDFSDPISYGPRILHEPFPNTPAKNILYQVAVDDSQVPNETSDKMARAMGIPLLTPSARHVYGLETVGDGQATSAMTYWDENLEPAPRTNTPPLADNKTHGSIRYRVELEEQIRQFLFGDGKVMHTCEGACSFNDGLQY